MGNDVIQAQYDKLADIANRFGGQAEASKELIGRVQQSMQPLQQGGWQGPRLAAFFGKMNGEVMPAMRRLIDALQQANSVTLEDQFIVKSAEEEASRPFKTRDSWVVPLEIAGMGGTSLGEAGAAPFSPTATGVQRVDTIGGGGFIGGGGGLWYATVFQNKPDFVGNARLGFKPPKGRWQRSFHLDGPHGSVSYPHFNAEIGPLKVLNHQRIPNWMHGLGKTSVLRGIGKATVVVGLAFDTYTIVYGDSRSTGGAIGGVAGGWGGALRRAAIGSAICPGIGTVIGGVIGGVAGGLVRQNGPGTSGLTEKCENLCDVKPI